MNIWNLLKKHDCINIKIDSIEEMKEILKLAKENNFYQLIGVIPHPQQSRVGM